MRHPIEIVPIAIPSDNELLQEFPTKSGVDGTVLDEQECYAAENAWRAIYGDAFKRRPRLRHGAKAEYEYEQEPCSHYWIVPFSSSGVAGLPVHILSRRLSADECHGPIVTLAAFHDIEFFVSPPNFAWAMVYTHEDYAFGGPYFIRPEWLRRNRRQSPSVE